MYSSTYSLPRALDGGEWSASRPGRFTSGDRAPGTHWIGGWMGSRAGLDAVTKRENPCPARESNPDRPSRSVVTILTELSRLSDMNNEFSEFYSDRFYPQQVI
jgi:hypothetical protein